MTFDNKSALKSDVVLFDGRKMTENITFNRARDQIWVFAAREPPLSYMEQGGWWTKEKWRVKSSQQTVVRTVIANTRERFLDCVP